MLPIETFIINRPDRSDRKQNALVEFENRPEFKVTFVEAICHPRGGYGLWQTIRQVVTHAIELNLEYILICEDDHAFTHCYSSDILWNCLEWGSKRGADIILGGVSSYNNPVDVSDYLFWVERFSGLQFTLVFASMYKKILNRPFTENIIPDAVFSVLCKNKFAIHPFISIQVEFGYSDITKENSIPGRVNELFKKSSEGLRINRAIQKKFHDEDLVELSIDILGENMHTPVYVLKQAGTPRFEILNEMTTLSGLVFRHPPNNGENVTDSWPSLFGIINDAEFNKEEFIVILSEDFSLSTSFDLRALMSTIVDGLILKADCISGGAMTFDNLIPAKGNLYWVSQFYCTPLLIVYRQAFRKILSFQVSDSVSIHDLVRLLSGKFILFPFIVTERIANSGEDRFNICADRINKIINITTRENSPS